LRCQTLSQLFLASASVAPCKSPLNAVLLLMLAWQTRFQAPCQLRQVQSAALTMLTVWSQAGLDSLGAVELRMAISARFAVDAPATLAFDYPTIAALVGFVASLLAPAPSVRQQTP